MSGCGLCQSDFCAVCDGEGDGGADWTGKRNGRDRHDTNQDNT